MRTAQPHGRAGPDFALSLNGANSYVDTGAAVLPASGDFTVEAWASCPAATSSHREILSQGSSARGVFLFGLTNTVGLDFTVLASTNLADWVVLSNSVPEVQFTDPDTAKYPYRFFRLRWPWAGSKSPKRVKWVLVFPGGYARMETKSELVVLNAKQVPGYVLKEPRVMADAAIQRFSSSYYFDRTCRVL